MVGLLLRQVCPRADGVVSIVQVKANTRAEVQAMCEDLAKVALERQQRTDWGRTTKDVPLSAIRDLGREFADRLEARWFK